MLINALPNTVIAVHSHLHWISENFVLSFNFSVGKLNFQIWSLYAFSKRDKKKRKVFGRRHQSSVPTNWALIIKGVGAVNSGQTLASRCFAQHKDKFRAKISSGVNTAPRGADSLEAAVASANGPREQNTRNLPAWLLTVRTIKQFSPTPQTRKDVGHWLRGCRFRSTTPLYRKRGSWSGVLSTEA